MSKRLRPSVVPDLDSMMVKAAAAEPAKPESRRESQTLAGSFRTSVWMSRAAHEILREIAHVERKAFADLFREGLDAVLTKRHYPTIAELETKDK